MCQAMQTHSQSLAVLLAENISRRSEYQPCKCSGVIALVSGWGSIIAIRLCTAWPQTRLRSDCSDAGLRFQTSPLPRRRGASASLEKNVCVCVKDLHFWHGQMSVVASPKHLLPSSILGNHAIRSQGRPEVMAGYWYHAKKAEGTAFSPASV